MGNNEVNLQYRLGGFLVLPIPAPEGGKAPAGVRIFPNVKLNADPCSLDFSIDAAAANAGATKSGAHYFDTNPTGTLSPASPVVWQYKPSGTDPFRANAGVRALGGACRLKDFQIRVGRHRYDNTEMVRLLMTKAYTWQTNFTHVARPLDWLGVEARYDRRASQGTTRQVLLSAAGMEGAGGTYLGMAQGLVTFAMADVDSPSPPQLTATAYVALRSNPRPMDGDVLDPGITDGEGGLVQFDDGSILTAAIAHAQFHSSSKKLSGEEVSERRTTDTAMIDVHPGRFRIRATLSSLHKRTDSSLTSTESRTEIHTEASLSYAIVDGLLVSIGYRGATGVDLNTHMGFLGVQTSFNGTLPLSSLLEWVH